MRVTWSVVVGGVLLIAGAAVGVAIADQLGVKEARKQLARLLGGSSNAIRIKSVSPGPIGSDTIVEAQVDLAFRMTERDGDWQVAEVRLPDGRWEEIALLKQALDRQKVSLAASDLQTLAEGVEAFHRERGFYPETSSFAALVDLIAPRFTPQVLRLDPWDRPFFYEPAPNGFRLGSLGPDGERGTSDDILIARERGGGRS